MNSEEIFQVRISSKNSMQIDNICDNMGNKIEKGFYLDLNVSFGQNLKSLKKSVKNFWKIFRATFMGSFFRSNFFFKFSNFNSNQAKKFQIFIKNLKFS